MKQNTMKRTFVIIALVFLQSAVGVMVVSVEEQFRIQQRQLEQQMQKLSALQSIQQEQIGEQIEQIRRQEEFILDRIREEDLRMKMEADAMKESLIPVEDDIVEEEENLNMEYVALSSQATILSSTSKKLTLSRADYPMSEPSTTSSKSFKKIRQRASTSHWGEFSCCRAELPSGLFPRRQRITRFSAIYKFFGDELISELNVKSICPAARTGSFCNTPDQKMIRASKAIDWHPNKEEDGELTLFANSKCFDTMDICVSLRDVQQACGLESRYKGFMSRNCPNACEWCDFPTPITQIQTQPTATSMAPESARAAQPPELRRVRVYINRAKTVYNYRFTTSPVRPRFPWRRIARSVHPGEVTSFLLYTRTFENFQMPIYFCKGGRTSARRRWLVSRRPCYGGWKDDMVLYASITPLQNTQKLYVANRGQAPWTSRIYRDAHTCCGYEGSVWNFFAPVVHAHTRKPFTNTNASRAATTILPTQNSRPDGSTQSPKMSSEIHLSSYQKECLDYHNLYRGAHGVSPFQWDSSLSETAQKWANYLLANAPRHPFRTKPHFRRSSNWPHSRRGSRYRGSRVGENIAWDLSPSGSPARESVLRWYAEIFDYNTTNPTYSVPGKPIGHFTQMLWKGTKYVGCAVAVRNIRRGSFVYRSTYSVAHYATAGNIHYSRPDKTRAAYQRNIPAPNSDTCMSSKNCSEYNNERSRCMGFSENIKCGCSREDSSVFGGRPQCKGYGGCMVSCKRPPAEGGPTKYFWNNECHGEVSCECVYTPVKARAGAVCS